MSKQLHQKSRAIAATLRLYLKLVLQGWKLTLPLFITVSVGTSLIFYVPPLVIASIINTPADGNVVTLSNGWIYLLLFGGSWLAGEMLWRVAFFLIQYFEVNAYTKLYNFTLEKLLEKDIGFFNDRFAGSITKNAIGFARRFENFFDTVIFEVVANIVPAIFGLIILSFISPLLSLALLGMMIVGIAVIIPLLRRRLRLVKDREEKHTVLAGHISDVVGNVAAVKAFGSENHELQTHKHHVKQYVDAAFKSWHYHNTRIDMVISPLYVAINVIGLAIILSLGVDNSTKGALFLAFSYYSTFSKFLWSFNSVYRRLEEAITEASLFIEYSLVPSRITDKKESRSLVASTGKITFDDVTFTHGDESLSSLFSELQFTIQSGQKVGLVGHSGAGKSTLVSLLLRFVDVDSGKILIDDTDIRQVSQQSLRQSIAYVPQESVLFHRSLADNIAYGRPDATIEEIRDAARQANALEFIETLPHKFDTLVGERGVKLSGGQRQRIAIARAILKDAPILLLDEATSALDSESEKLIQESLEVLMKRRTSIVIAHRLSTIAKMDRIIVLDNGRIVEDGTHTNLIKRNGTYASLWAHQSGGFIEE